MADGTAIFYSCALDLSVPLWTGDDFGFTMYRSGESSAPVSAAAYATYSSMYVHHAEDYSYIMSIADIGAPWTSYVNLAWATELAMEGMADYKSWSNDFFDIDFNASDGTYTFQNQTAGAGVFDIAFDNTASANLFGFSSTDHSGASIYTSTYVAAYLIYPAIDARSMLSREYEPGGISSGAVTDSGVVQKGNARTSTPKYMDWKQAHEPIAAVFTEDAASTTFWTWQQFFEQCRQSEPFIVATVSAGNAFECHMLRETASNFKPEPMEIDNHESWHIHFETVFMGRYSQ